MPSARPRSNDAYARQPSYAQRSRQPLHILLFLLPLLIAYEVGSIVYLTLPSDSGPSTIRIVEAQGILAGFFRVFGVAGLHLPAVALVLVLLIQHVLTRNSWAIRPRTIGLMASESFALALPLLLLAMVMTTAPLAAASGLAELPWQARATIALGAGLYEELLFRMILIEALHLIAADLLRLKEWAARALAVVVSAIAFAAYHDLTSAGGGLDAPRALFMVLAGIYFGFLYITRGFGIVVGVHAVYDLIVLVAIASPAATPMTP